MGSLMDFFVVLFGGSDASSKQKLALRKLAKEISQSRFHNFYGVRNSEVRRPFGIFIYDLYKALYPTSQFLFHAEKSAVLKQLVAEQFLSREAREIQTQIAPELIAERAKSINPQDLARQVEEGLNVVSGEIKQASAQINRCYGLIMAFVRFVRFDFFSYIKKNDSRLQEGDFTVQPQFRNLPGKYAAPFIKDFVTLSFPDAGPEDWRRVFAVLKEYKSGVAMIDLPQWKKTLSTVQDVLKSRVLVAMVRHIEGNAQWDTDWEQSALSNPEDMAAGYLRTKTGEVKTCIDKLMRDKRIAKRESLAKELFGSADITRLHHYTAAANEPFIKKNLGGFLFVAPLNYMQAFFTDRQSLRDLCDMFMIRGHWASQEVSRQASQELHKLSEIAEALTEFDESVSDKGGQGARLRTALNKSAMEKTQLNNVIAILDMMNAKAQELVIDGIQSFTTVSARLNALHGDFTNAKEALLVNWKELESLSEQPIIKRVEQGYRFLDDFVMLLRLFVSENV